MGGFDPNDDAPERTAAAVAGAGKSKNARKRQKKRKRGADAAAAGAAAAGTAAAAADAAGTDAGAAGKKGRKAKKGRKGKKGRAGEAAAAAGAAFDDEAADDGGDAPVARGAKWSGGFNFGSGGGGGGFKTDGAVEGFDAPNGAALTHTEQLVTYVGEGGADAGVEFWYQLPGANDKAPAANKQDGAKRRKRVDANTARELGTQAAALLAADSAAWGVNRGLTGRSVDKWLVQVLRSGTLTDRVASLSLLVRDSPVHTITQLDALLSMARKKSRREAGLAIDALRYEEASALNADHRASPVGLIVAQ